MSSNITSWEENVRRLDLGIAGLKKKVHSQHDVIKERE